MRKRILALFVLLPALLLTGCGGKSEKKLVRIGHNQSQNHPTHKGLVAFEEFIEEELGDRYEVEVYPSELLGTQTDMVQLTQTGALDFCVASNAILETFDDVYEIFNLPYLFASSESYHRVMDDPEIIEPIFTSTKESGFEAVTWLDAGSRSFYTKDVPVMSPEDLSGLKIRVQQSPTNVRMMELLGSSATPMGFGEVYTALQQGIIDGAENNEMALTDNGHGEVCQYYSYDMHQMVPDILIGNYRFLDEMDPKERKVFEEGFDVLNQVQREAWVESVEAAKEKATEMGVEFLYPDQKAFVEACAPLTEEVLSGNEKLRPYYNRIQEYNEQYPAKEEEE